MNAQGTAVALYTITRREVALLEVLMARPQRVFSKAELLNQLFGFGLGHEVGRVGFGFHSARVQAAKARQDFLRRNLAQEVAELFEVDHVAVFLCWWAELRLAPPRLPRQRGKGTSASHRTYWRQAS